MKPAVYLETYKSLCGDMVMAFGNKQETHVKAQFNFN